MHGSRTFTVSALPALGAHMALLLVFLASSPASARVVLAPWSGNIALIGSRSTAGGVVDQQSQAPTGPQWNGMVVSSADNDTTGDNAFATMTMGMQFNDSLFAVTSQGSGVADGATASNRAGTLHYVQFVVERTQSYATLAYFTPGQLGTSHTLGFLVNLASKDLPTRVIAPGEPLSGRLAPGLYAYYLENRFGDDTGSGSSNALTSQVSFQEVPSPLIAQHPQNQTVTSGAAASFSVGASGLAAAEARAPLALSYQWRRRYQNLADGGRVTGATTAQLHIADAAIGDTGVYDCVVTQGSIQEPSSLARLTVTGGTAGVDDAPSRAGLALGAPAPNPFVSRTRVRFTLPVECPVWLDVLDVAGRRVVVLRRGERLGAGAHSVEWDGSSERGVRAVAGLYFVRLATPQGAVMRRVVRAD